MVTGQNGSGQNVIGQNGTDKLVAIFGSEFNIYLFSKQKSQISDKHIEEI